MEGVELAESVELRGSPDVYGGNASTVPRH